MNFQDLSNVHTGRYTQRVQHDIQWTSVRKEWHILNRKYTGNDTLVTMTTSHLITNGDFSLLCDVDTYRLINSWRQLITIFSCEYLGVYNDTILTVWYLKGSITNLACFLTKDCTKKSLLCCKLSLSLRSNLTNKDITSTNLCTDTNDSALIKNLELIITYARNITGDLFRSKLCITGFCFIFFNVNRCINIVLYKFLT